MASKRHFRLATKILVSPDHRRVGRLAEERAFAKEPEKVEHNPIPSSSVVRLTGEYVPYVKYSHVDFEKVHHTL
jgi:hypothetical protein